MNNNKLAWVQSIRAFAAIYVMLFHSIPFWELIEIQWLSKALTFISSHGYAGVDIFFPISGYVIGLSILNKDRTLSTGLTFLQRRFLRIFLGYWPILLLTIILSILDIRPLHDFGAKLLDSVFLLSPVMSDHLLEVSWSLSYELYFYLIIFVGVFIFHKLSIIKSCMTLLLFLLIYNSYWYIFQENTYMSAAWPFRYSLSALTIEFLIGVYIATLNPAIFKHKELLPLFLIIACLSLLSGSHSLFFANYELPRLTTYGIFGVSVLICALILENSDFKAPKQLSTIGDASYSLYLLHPLVLSCAAMAVHSLPTDHFLRQVILISLPISCILLSKLWFKTIEKPLYEASKNYNFKRLVKPIP